MEVYLKNKDGSVHICYSAPDVDYAKSVGFTEECGPGGVSKEAPKEAAPKKRGRPKKTEE